MTRKTKRLAIILAMGSAVLTAVVFIAIAMSSTAAFFVVPSDLRELRIVQGQNFRLGGIVKLGSLISEGEVHRFAVTDCKDDIIVVFKGIPGGLFREGQEIIAEGAVQGDGTFAATRLLAKHDEEYVPKDMVDRFQERGLCKGYKNG